MITKLKTENQRLFYLSPSDQESLGYESFKYLPWNHFGRKNLGFLFAIENGAEIIYDTGNVLYTHIYIYIYRFHFFFLIIVYDPFIFLCIFQFR